MSKRNLALQFREVNASMDVPHAVPATRGDIASVVEQIGAERRRLALMRLSFAGVCLSWLLLLAWAVPWIPVGMTVSDYSVTTAVGLILAVAMAAASLAFLFVWGPTFRHESLQEFLRVLFGGTQLIRGRGQLYSRLAIECHRAKRDGRNVFSLIVVQLAKPESGPGERQQQPEDDRILAAMLVRSLARDGDIVADSWPREVWVLALGADEEACRGITRRMARSLADPTASLPSFAGARIGSSSFGPGREEPEEVFAAAYEELVPLAAFAEPRAAA